MRKAIGMRRVLLWSCRSSNVWKLTGGYMRIKELHIEKFEELENQKIFLEDGINIFYGENESGKTMIHTFIRWMFFDENQYSACSGTLRFQENGKTYLIQKRQGKHFKNNTLLCEEDGKRYSVSKVLNGLQRFDYENTISIGQRKIGHNRDRDLDYELQIAMETILKLEEEIEDVKDRYIKYDESREIKRSFWQRSWRIHPGIVLLMLIVIIFIFSMFPSPSNYLIGVVVVLGDWIFVWNRLKVGNKKKDRYTLKETRHAMNKLKKQHVNLKMKLEQEKDSKEKVLDLVDAMNERASEIIGAITGGKYTKIFTDEKLGTRLCMGDTCSPIDRLSQSTKEQVYFALRMATAEIMHLQDYPLILDDTFAYYDDRRLENTLRWLQEENKQVLLFTCHRREQEIWNKIQKNIDNSLQVV